MIWSVWPDNRLNITCLIGGVGTIVSDDFCLAINVTVVQADLHQTILGKEFGEVFLASGWNQVGDLVKIGVQEMSSLGEKTILCAAADLTDKDTGLICVWHSLIDVSEVDVETTVRKIADETVV